MHIAVLMTNTDETAFAQAHPKDGEKFAAMLHSVRPDWKVTVYAVKDGEFPAETAKFDGWLITGSPASVHDDAAWVQRLFALIRKLVAQQAPLYGACFGHQAIAQALGGRVGHNPNGWVFGLTETSLEGQSLWLYAAHKEQVLALPPAAVAVGGNADCPVGAFAIGRHVLTTQYHPEMTHGFMQALTAEMRGALPDAVVAASERSLAQGVAESARIAERIAQFFEAAQTSA